MRIAVHNNIFLRLAETPAASADIWFFHALGDSGLNFLDVFTSPLASAYNLYVPDMPGFGVTPKNSDALTVQGAADVLCELILDLSRNRPLILVAHSMSSLIATRVADGLPEQVKFYFNIEGNLTRADTYFSGLATQYDTVSDFHTAFKRKIFSLLKEDGALHRYYASVRFADPESLWHLGRSGTAVTGETNGGDEFLRLRCRKVYYWDSESTAPETLAYLELANLPNRQFWGSGH